MTQISRAGTREWARAADIADPLAAFRSEFLVPAGRERQQAYFCGNSLGLQPRATSAALIEELEDWQNLAVEGHFRGRRPWMTYHELVRDDLAAVVGAEPVEVVAMNSLSVNLHLMMASFYRPTAPRHAILIERGAFPSDRYAVEGQLRLHGHDPATALIELDGDEPNGTLSTDAIVRAIDKHASRIALIVLPGVQYLTGQAFDLGAITRAAHAKGCLIGFDLAHATGNIDLSLHDSGCDFAVWCSYKYLNAGPGAVAGCFVHARHANSNLPRMAGWWGHDQSSRFRMEPGFVPMPGADGWQLSNPPILALSPLRVSLEIFRRAGIDRLREKSIALTGYFEWLIRSEVGDVLEIITPPQTERRGAQLSLRVNGPRDTGRALFDCLHAQDIIVDWREPDVIRAAPVPMYTTYEDCLRLVMAVAAWRDAR